MTNEEIKQAAEEYYQKLDSITIEDPRQPNVNSIIDAYTAGAHSRDGEVENLENALHSVNEYCHQLRNKVYELSNPWISVEERLPEDDRDCLFMGNHIPVCFGRYYPDSLSGAVWSCDDGYWTPAKEVTHWMPIPELKKGE